MKTFKNFKFKVATINWYYFTIILSKNRKQRFFGFSLRSIWAQQLQHDRLHTFNRPRVLAIRLFCVDVENVMKVYCTWKHLERLLYVETCRTSFDSSFNSSSPLTRKCHTLQWVWFWSDARNKKKIESQSVRMTHWGANLQFKYNYTN